MLNKTLALVSIGCALFVGCKSADEKTEPTSSPATAAAPKTVDAEHDGTTDMTSQGLPLNVTLPSGASARRAGKGAVMIFVGGKPFLAVMADDDPVDRATAEADRLRQKGLQVVKSEDLPNGWVVTFSKDNQFDVQRFRSDLGVMCEKRKLPDAAAAATALAICDSLSARK